VNGPGAVSRIGGSNVAAYVIADIEITEPVTYDEYKKAASEALTRYGGRFIVRGGKTEKLEGSWDPKRVIILEFESLEQAKRWWASEEYKAPKELRRSASTANMILVDGL
jgi:uncharacterized protein (DUF1330 family)